MTCLLPKITCITVFKILRCGYVHFYNLAAVFLSPPVGNTGFEYTHLLCRLACPASTETEATGCLRWLPLCCGSGVWAKSTCMWTAYGSCIEECPSVILMPCCQSASSALCLVTSCWPEHFSGGKSFVKLARMRRLMPSFV